MGPIEAKHFAAQGEDPRPHAAVGFVLGAFGELPSSFYSLCDAIAGVDAACVASF